MSSNTRSPASRVPTAKMPLDRKLVESRLHGGPGIVDAATRAVPAPVDRALGLEQARRT